MAPVFEDLGGALVVAGGGVGVVTPGSPEDEEDPEFEAGGKLAVGIGVAVDSGASPAARATDSSNPVVQFK